MKRNAQSLVEFSLLAAFVVIVAISVGAIFNNQKSRLTAMSKVDINIGSVLRNLVQSEDSTDSKWKEAVPFTPIQAGNFQTGNALGSTVSVETAGALSLLGFKSIEEFNEAVSKITYEKLNAVINPNSGKDILTLANELRAKYSPNYPVISKSEITPTSIAKLASLLSSVPTQIPADAKPFIESFKELLTTTNQAILPPDPGGGNPPPDPGGEDMIDPGDDPTGNPLGT